MSHVHPPSRYMIGSIILGGTRKQVLRPGWQFFFKGRQYVLYTIITVKSSKNNCKCLKWVCTFIFYFNYNLSTSTTVYKYIYVLERKYNTWRYIYEFIIFNIILKFYILNGKIELSFTCFPLNNVFMSTLNNSVFTWVRNCIIYLTLKLNFYFNIWFILVWSPNNICN